MSEPALSAKALGNKLQARGIKPKQRGHEKTRCYQGLRVVKLAEPSNWTLDD